MRAVLGPYHAIERMEGGQQDRPHVAITLAAEPRHHLEILREGYEAGDGGRPRVVDEVEALDGSQPVGELGEQALQQLAAVAHAVEAVPALVHEDRGESRRHGDPRLLVAEQQTLDAAAGRSDA